MNGRVTFLFTAADGRVSGERFLSGADRTCERADRDLQTEAWNDVREEDTCESSSILMDLCCNYCLSCNLTVILSLNHIRVSLLPPLPSLVVLFS